MKIGVISFTRAGAEKNLELTALLQEKNHQAASFSWHKFTGRRLIPFQSLRLLFQDLWDSQDVLLFLGEMDKAAGAFIPFGKEKGEGPAAVLVDEEGRFVIPFAKGRMAGLNGWCAQFAQAIGATAVLTGRTEASRRFAVDAFARKNNLHIQDMFRIQTLAQALSEGEPVGVYSDYPIEGVLPEGMVGVGTIMGGQDRPFFQDVPDGAVPKEPAQKPACGISVTDDWEAPHFERECRMFPRNLAIGVVCRAGKPRADLERFVFGTLALHHLSRERIGAIYSTSNYAGEEGIVEMADGLNVPYYTYSHPQLLGGNAEGRELSESCALLGSGHGKCLVPCRKEGGMEVSVYERAIHLHF